MEFTPLFRVAITHHLNRLLGLAVLMALSCAPLASFAQDRFAPVLSYDKFVFQLQSTTPLDRPQWETWESESRDLRTQMIVVDFPNLGESAAAVNSNIQQLREDHPEIKRLMAMKMGGNTMRLVIEVANPPRGKKLLEPKIRQTAPNQVQVLLFTTTKPEELGDYSEAPVAPATPKQQAALNDVSQLTPANDETVEPAPIPAQADPIKSKPVQPQPKKSLLPKFPSAADNAAKKLETEKSESDKLELEKLKESMALRNAEIQVLKKQVDTIKAKNDTLEKHLNLTLADNANLQEKTKAQPATVSPAQSQDAVALYERLQQIQAERDLYKQQLDSMPSQRMGDADIPKSITTLTGDQVADSKTIEALRRSLSTMVQKLKTYQDDNTALRRELATLKNDPSIINLKPDSQAAVKLSPINVANEEEIVPDTVSYKPSAEKTNRQKAELMLAIENQPAQSDSYYKLYDLYLQEGDYSNAEHTLNNLLLVSPTNAKAYLSLTDLYLKQKQLLKAKATLDTYQRLSSKAALQDPKYQKLSQEIKKAIQGLPQKS